MSRQAVQVWLDEETIAWLRATRGYSSIQGRAEHVIETARTVGPPKRCACGCGREFFGKGKTASQACRQRLHRKNAGN